MLVCVGLLTASGCVAGPVDAAVERPGGTSKSALAPSPTPTESGPAVDAVDLGFGAEEEQIAGDWAVGWLDPFPDEEERFVYTAPEDGPGAYEYLDRENECTIAMELSRLADQEMPEDDPRISDTMLAANVIGSTSAADVEAMGARAEDDSLWQEAEAATVDFRVWHGMSEQGSAVLAARGFGGMAVGMLLGVFCPAGADAVSEYKEIVGEYARILVRWPTEE